MSGIIEDFAVRAFISSRGKDDSHLEILILEESAAVRVTLQLGEQEVSGTFAGDDLERLFRWYQERRSKPRLGLKNAEEE